MKLELNAELLNKIVKKLAALGPFLAMLAMLGAIGYCGWRASQSLNVVPSEAAVEAVRSTQAATKIRFDVKVINSLNALVEVPTTIDTTTVGKNNPFAP